MRIGIISPQRKRPRSCLNVAFIYAGNYLLPHTRVGRTLLSAAFDFGVALDLFRTERDRNQHRDQLQRLRTGVSAPHNQRCYKTELIGCTYVTDYFLATAI